MVATLADKPSPVKTDSGLIRAFYQKLHYYARHIDEKAQQNLGDQIVFTKPPNVRNQNFVLISDGWILSKRRFYFKHCLILFVI